MSIGVVIFNIFFVNSMAAAPRVVSNEEASVILSSCLTDADGLFTAQGKQDRFFQVMGTLFVPVFFVFIYYLFVAVAMSPDALICFPLGIGHGIAGGLDHHRLRRSNFRLFTFDGLRCYQLISSSSPDFPKTPSLR